MNAYERETEGGVLLSGRDWQVVAGGTALMAVNVLLMYIFAATPLAVINDYLFAVPIVGALVYGAAIMGGELVAERGVENDNTALAVAGVAILEVAFGTFGAGIISFLAPEIQLLALGITAVVTTLLTLLIGVYVYARSGTTFDHYSTWSTYAFLGGLGAILVGSIVPAVLVVGFVLIFLGFTFRLGWEIWRVRDGHVRSVSLQAIGLYVAVAGVFVHVLQIVVRMLARR